MPETASSSPVEIATTFEALLELAHAAPARIPFLAVEGTFEDALALQKASSVSVLPRRRPVIPLVTVGARPVAFKLGPNPDLSEFLARAPGAVAGLDEQRAGVTVFRTLSPARVLGRTVPAGSTVLVGRRPCAPGDIAVLATPRGMRFQAAEEAEGSAVPSSAPMKGRLLGIVEGVIAPKTKNPSLPTARSPPECSGPRSA